MTATARTIRRLSAAMAAVAVLTAGGFLAGWSAASSTAADGRPDADGVDVGFARDMSVHHAQAVEMSRLVLETSTDPAVRTLAADILLSQQQQIGQMYAWLDVWDATRTSGATPMAWMAGSPGSDMSTPDDTMPGMAPQAGLERLDALSGRDADRWYLQLMIPHHQGGVTMAEAAQTSAETEQVRRLAGVMARSQGAEIDLLQQMLAARGGPLR